MRFKLYREYGALNSKPVFDAVEQGLRCLGHEIVESDEDIPVIWSVLWSGRMSANKKIYDHYRNLGKNVLIVEVGNFFRGKTWRISFNNINQQGIFGNKQNLDLDRPKKMGIFLKNIQHHRSGSILIATQHEKSLQWQGQPSLDNWTRSLIHRIRLYSNRPIVVRPHPRCKFFINFPNVMVETPKLISGTYDDFDINYNHHCVINHNSGPAVQAALNGVPVICDHSSLAYPISDFLENIENIRLKDREEWLVEMSHTEWTVQEISSGIPFQRILTEN